MENNDKKSNRFKELIKGFKEAWAVPRKRAGIKLLGYLLFFILFFVIAGLSVSNNSISQNHEKTINTTTTLDTESYTYKQKLLLENKHYVNYDILIGEEIYKINGNINKGILDGYLESSNDIKKIKLEDSILYHIDGEESRILNLDLNLKFIDVNSIINTIVGSRAYIEEKEGIKIYSYNINSKMDDNCNIKVYTNTERIEKIEISGNIYSYKLYFEV